MLVKRNGRQVDVDLRHRSKVTSDDSHKFFKFTGDHIFGGVFAGCFLLIGVVSIIFVNTVPLAVKGPHILLATLFNLLGLTITSLMLLDARNNRKRATDRVESLCWCCGRNKHNQLTVEQATTLRDALTIAIESH